MNFWQILMDDEKIAPDRGGIPPEDRAGVTKTRIAETEATKRKRIEEREATKRARASQESFLIQRAFIVIIAIIVSGLVSYEVIQALHDIRSKQLTGQPIPNFVVKSSGPL